MSSTHIVFIDSRISNFQTLIDNLTQPTEVFILDGQSDGLAQMAALLQGRTDIDAVHIISHGSQGTLYLGSTVLDSYNLSMYRTQLSSIGAALTQTGDILLYGCYVGAGEAGSAFVNALAQMTGADVAASDDVTGAGGNWTLETSSGAIETAGLTADSYASTLQPIFGTEGHDTLVGDGLDNTIYGYGGNDSIDGQAAHDLIDGGLGNDTIDGNFGNDTIYGGLGDDTLIDSQGSNQLFGEDGNDTLSSKALTGNDTLSGGLGNDILVGTGQNVVLYGNEDSDTLTATGALDVNNTTSYVQHGNATLSGGAGDDGSWYDAAWAQGGIYAYGGLQASYLANALLQGNDGNDYLHVDYSKNARLEGGAGADILRAYAYGYAMNYIGESYGINYQLDGGADNDILQVTSSAHRYYGRIDLALEGGTGNDTLTVSTNQPADVNVGISSASLSGGDGDDRLEANGVLQLTLTGGAGTDTFVLTAQQAQAQLKGTMQFATQQATSANGYNYAFVDVAARSMDITDFAAGRSGEILDIRDLLQNGASNYDGTNPFKSGHIDLVQSGADTLLKFDASGGSDNFVTLAVLKDVKSTELVAKNFSPLFGTPNGDVMSGLHGNVRFDGLGGNDVMVTADMPNDDPNWDAQLDTALQTYQDLTNETNVLDGGEGADTMAGGNGDDVYYVDSIGDVVKEATGQGHADKVIAAIDYALGANIENLQIGAGAANGTKGLGNALGNILQANEAGNELDAGEGNDEVLGGLGNDNLKGGKGNDHLKGGSGDDTVDAGEGDDEIVGGDGAGNDIYMGGSGIDTVRYTSAITGITVNLLTGVASGNEIGSDTLSGIENVIGGQAGDAITGDTLANGLDGFTGNDIVSGGYGNDTLNGGEGNDTLYGNQDNDQLNGGTGDDWMHGGAGNDSLWGNQGQDIMQGGIGNDWLHGGQGNDTVDGGAGNDTVIGGVGNDTLIGGDGIDTADYSAAADAVTVNLLNTKAQFVCASQGSDVLSGIENLTGGSAGDTLTGDNAANLLNGLGGNDSISGGYGNDTLQGGDGNDTLYGNQDNDQLLGDNGNDWMHGGQGNDTLNGGAGIDQMAGGLGTDTFVFNLIADTGITSLTWDTIADFSSAQLDKIDLSAMDANTSTGTNDAFGSIVAGGVFSGAFASPGELYFDSVNHVLYGNTDADATAEFAVALTGVSSLTAADLVF